MFNLLLRYHKKENSILFESMSDEFLNTENRN